jgi:hypothetical protein
MTDETQQDPALEDRLTDGTAAHGDDPEENPEDHIGEEIPDPWEDSSQMDWPNAEPLVELDGGPTVEEV